MAKYDCTSSADTGDAVYCSTVLRLPADSSEDQVDLQLLSRAHGLGIRASLPAVSYRHRRAVSVALSDSTASDGSVSTYLMPHSSIIGPPSPDVTTVDAAVSRPSKTWSFSPYDKLLAQYHAAAAADPSKPAAGSAQSIFSVSTKKSGLAGFRSRMMLRRKPIRVFEPSLFCVSCRSSFPAPTLLQALSCGHSHCADCLRRKVAEASTLQEVMEPAAQEAFLRAAVQFSTPWESRIFCPTSS